MEIDKKVDRADDGKNNPAMWIALSGKFRVIHGLKPCVRSLPGVKSLRNMTPEAASKTADRNRAQVQESCYESKKLLSHTIQGVILSI